MPHFSSLLYNLLERLPVSRYSGIGEKHICFIWQDVCFLQFISISQTYCRQSFAFTVLHYENLYIAINTADSV